MCEISQVMSPTIGNLAAALAKAQGTFTFAKKESEAPLFEKGGVRSGKRTYADLASVLDAVRAGLAANELSIVQTPFSTKDGGVTLRTTLMHSSGEWIASEFSMPADRMGAIQGWGSALTYARRYALAAMCGIAQDDDDGQAAQDAEPRNRKAREQAEHKAIQQKATAANPQPLNPNQQKALMARLGELGCKQREDYLRELSNVLGREIKTSKELTAEEFTRFMLETEMSDMPQVDANTPDPFQQAM